MSEAPYVPFYTSDFLGGTSGMTAATKGVYITLLCLMYEAEAPLPQSWETLARRCGATLPAFRKAVESLQDDGKIAVTDAGLWSQKCDRHIAQRRERQNSATAAAKKRWEKSKQKQGKPDKAASSAQCQPEPEPEPYKREDTNVSLSASADTTPHVSAVSEAVSAYNAAAEKAGWPKVQRMTPQRTRSLRARLGECGGVEGWGVALRRALDSDFLCGRTAKQWTGFGFDWIVKASNFTKVMEGNYDNRDRKTADDPALRAIATAARAF